VVVDEAVLLFGFVASDSVDFSDGQFELFAQLEQTGLEVRAVEQAVVLLVDFLELFEQHVRSAGVEQLDADFLDHVVVGLQVHLLVAWLRSGYLC